MQSGSTSWVACWASASVFLLACAGTPTPEPAGDVVSCMSKTAQGSGGQGDASAAYDHCYAGLCIPQGTDCLNPDTGLFLDDDGFLALCHCDQRLLDFLVSSPVYGKTGATCEDFVPRYHGRVCGVGEVKVTALAWLSADDCVQSGICKSSGLCSFQATECADASGCKPGFCKHAHNVCYPITGYCYATDADCAQSDACKNDGKCSAGKSGSGHYQECVN